MFRPFFLFDALIIADLPPKIKPFSQKIERLFMFG